MYMTHDTDWRTDWRSAPGYGSRAWCTCGWQDAWGHPDGPHTGWRDTGQAQRAADTHTHPEENPMNSTLPVYTVTDTITGETLTGTSDELEAALPAWFPEAPAEVTEAIGQLFDALRRDDYRGDLEHFLAVDVRQA
jgi:hypothetical protein